MSTRWDEITRLRVWSGHLGWTLLGVAIFVAVVSIWHPEVRTVATIFTLLSMHALSGSELLRRMANMQAALDMKRIMIKAPLVTQNQRIKSGEPFELVARDGTKFVVTPNVSVDVKVEYKG